MILGLSAFTFGAAIFLVQEGARVQFDPTVSLTTLLQLPILVGVGYVVRFISIQKDFPPHRHVNGHVLYPKGYTPDREEKAKGASA